MKKLMFASLAACLLTFISCSSGNREQATNSAPVNIVFIMADDLGYGDVQSLNPSSEIPTPNIDQLTSQGLSFTNAHASASVCTPTRYSFLTGRYSWRTSMKNGVKWVWDGPMIDSGRYTVGEMLQNQGYHTACIGKWHLGVDWPTFDGRRPTLQNQGKNVDYDKPIENGPVDHGFHYYFGQETPSFPPHAFIEDDRMAKKPTAWLDPGMMDQEQGSLLPAIPGAMAPGWRYEDLMYAVTDKAVEYIEARAGSDPGKPFFLYFAMPAPHTPIAPHENFEGTTEVGRYGDYVYEMDYHVGRILNALDSLGIANRTMVIFTSDNGGVNEDGLKYTSQVGDLVKNYGHNSNGELRGLKSDAWEGGHRVPFVVRWPGKVKKGSTSGALLSLVDMMATFAAATGAEIPEGAGEDSYNMLPVFMGERQRVREAVVNQSGEGILAIQKGDWKLIACSGGGGKWSGVGEAPEPETTDGTRIWKNVQLYNMASDWREQENLASQQPEKVEELMKTLKDYILSGRSTTGPALNDGEVELWKQVKWLEEINDQSLISNK